MPESLLKSQLDLLQLDEAEGINMEDSIMSFQGIINVVFMLLSTNKLN